MILVTLLISTFVNQLVPVGVPSMNPGFDNAPASRDASVPLVCDARNALLVPVSIQETPARPFLLDTGSSITMIDSRLAAELALAPAGRITSPSGSDPLVTAQIRVGPIVLPAGRVISADFRPLSPLLGKVGGILGSDALRAMGDVTIDYARCLLTVGGASAEPDPPAMATLRHAQDRPGSSRRATRIPLVWHEGRPVITVGGGARLVLDSGAATVTVFSDTPAAATLRWNSRAALLVRIERVDGPRMGRLGELACLTIGGIALRNVAAVGVRTWYDRHDAQAPDGLLPLALFARVHLSHAEGYVELVPHPDPASH